MLKRYFVTGLLLWGPLVITVWVLNLIVGTMDQSLALLPAKWQPQVWLGRDIPSVGVSSGQEEDTMVSVFVPTTPNPTSGFFLMMRREETVELDMSVDAALKYIVSMGVVAPPVGRNEAETNHE